MTTAFDFEFVAIDGRPLPLRQFAGHPMLVVNVASKCELTPQYAGLQKIWEEYRDRGLVVLGVPSNQFWQEPAKELEIAAFCRVTYSITFPLTEKTRVKGGKAHPFFKWMCETMGHVAKPSWNFHKLLTGKQGEPRAAFASRTEPHDQRLRTAIEDALI